MGGPALPPSWEDCLSELALAELHLHLYGTIPAPLFPDFVRDRPVDWRFYEAEYERVYGVMPPLRDILRRHRRGDPTAAGDFQRLFIFGDADAGAFARFQAKYNVLLDGTGFMALGADEGPGSPRFEELRFFLAGIIARQQREGIAYAEQRVDLETAQGRPPTPHVLRAVLRLYAEGAAADPGFTPRATVTLPRRNPWSHWPLVQELALGPHGAWLTGIDFCYIEEGHPPRDQRAFFAAVRDFNRRHPERALAILYHVGESFTDKSLESAVRWVQEAAEFGAHRLGHAIALGLDPAHFGEHERAESVAERRDQLRYDLAHAGGLRRHGVAVDDGAIRRELDALAALPADRVLTIPYDAARLCEVRRRQDHAMARVHASGAIVEVCPTSNRRIGGIADPAHHPVQRFLTNDVAFVIGTDDPGIFGTSLREEIDWVIQAARLPPETFETLAARAWRYRSEILSGREPAT